MNVPRIRSFVCMVDVETPRVPTSANVKPGESKLSENLLMLIWTTCGCSGMSTLPTAATAWMRTNVHFSPTLVATTADVSIRRVLTAASADLVTPFYLDIFVS